MNVLEDAQVNAAGHAPAAEDLPHTAVSTTIDAVIRTLGEAASWLWPILMMVIVAQVGMRYLLGQGSIMLEELQWHIYGVGFLFGLGFCLQADRHVRIDVLSDRFSPRTRGWVEVIGITVFLLPFTLAVIFEGSRLAYTAWELNEVSAAPDGLPHRWIIKSMIVVGFLLLLAAAVSRLTRCSALLFGFPKPFVRG